MVKRRGVIRPSKKVVLILILLLLIGSFLYVYFFQREKLLLVLVDLEPGKPPLSFSYLQKSRFSNIGGVEKANWIRFFIVWNNIELEKGKYDFSFLDLVVKRFQKDNKVLVLTILPFANWDQDKCHDDSYIAEFPVPGGMIKVKAGKPCNMNDYIDFLKVLVERYDGDGVNDMPGLRYPIKYWEIMNEPGMQKSILGLKFFCGSPEDYLEILKVSYQTIKQVDPDAKVLMGGMAGMEKEFVDFWSKIISEAKDYFDIANVHSINTDEDREDLYLFKFKEFLKSYGVDDKPIWITEAQYGDLFVPPKDLVAAEKLLVRSTVFAFANGAEKIFHIGNWYEFWKTESTQKVYETLVNKIDYFDSVEIIKQEYKETFKGVKTIIGQYKFTIGDHVIYVLWGDSPLPEELKGKVLKVTNIYGDEKIVENYTEIKLSDSPIYVEIVNKQSSNHTSQHINLIEFQKLVYPRLSIPNGKILEEIGKVVEGTRLPIVEAEDNISIVFWKCNDLVMIKPFSRLGAEVEI